MKNMVDSENTLRRHYNPCKCQRVIMRDRCFNLKPDDEIIIISEKFKDMFFFLCSKNLSDAPDIPHVNPRDLICVACEKGFESLEILKAVLSNETASSAFEIFYKGTKLYDIAQLTKNHIPYDRCIEIELISVRENIVEVKHALNYFTTVTLQMDGLSTDTFDEISIKTLDKLGIEPGINTRFSMSLDATVLENNTSICSIDDRKTHQGKTKSLSRQKGHRIDFKLALTLHVYHETSCPIIINLPESEQTVTFYRKESPMMELHNEIGKSIQRHPCSFQIGIQSSKSRKGKIEVINDPAELWKECEILFLDKLVLKCNFENWSFIFTMFRGQSIQELKVEVSKHIAIECFLFDLIQGKCQLDPGELVDSYADKNIQVERNHERMKIKLHFCGSIKDDMPRMRVIEIQHISSTFIADIIQEVSSYFNKNNSFLQAIYDGSCLDEKISVKDSGIRHLDFLTISQIVPPFQMPFRTRVVFSTNLEGFIEGKIVVEHGGILFYGQGDLSFEDSRKLFATHGKGLESSTEYLDMQGLDFGNRKEIDDTRLMRSYERPSGHWTDLTGQRPLRSKSAVEMGSNVNPPTMSTNRSVSLIGFLKENENQTFRKHGIESDSISLCSGRSPSLASLSSQDIFLEGVDNLKLVGKETQEKTIYETDDSLFVRNISIKEEIQTVTALERTNFKDLIHSRPNEKKIENQFYNTIALEIGKTWKPVGRSLGMDEIDLEDIECSHQGLKERTYQMLILWRQKYGQEASKDKLRNALIENSLRSVAEKI